MAEIADRMEIEADFARRLARQSGQHRKELFALIDLLNPLGIPPQFWAKVEEEKRKTMYAQLAFIFMLSADQNASALLPGDMHAAATAQMSDAADQWATYKSREFASQFVQRSQAKLKDDFDRWFNPDFKVRRLQGDTKPAASRQE